LVELLAGESEAGDQGFANAFRAEAHNRIASPLFSCAVTLLGVYALLGGRFDRRGQSSRILAAGILVLAVEGMSIGLADLARNSWLAIPLLYLAALTPIAILLVLFARANDGLPPWRIWLRTVAPAWAMGGRAP
jgi:lipopolysaccharide export system permease protein